MPKSAIANVPIATFNDLATVERRFKENPGEIAAIILEPILMNVGLCMPQPGFLKGLREICDKNGALLIFDEVKTGAKLGWGGASEYFGVKPDMICLAKSIGGGLPLAAFGTHKSVMDLISQHKVFHGGTYNTNPVSMAAGLATFREVLTRENYAQVDKLSKKLADGYRETIAKVGLQAYIAQAGANGALMLYPKEIRNYRDWDNDRHRSVAPLLVRHGQPRRDGSTLLVGRAVDDLGAAHRGGYRQASGGLQRYRRVAGESAAGARGAGRSRALKMRDRWRTLQRPACSS